MDKANRLLPCPHCGGDNLSRECMFNPCEENCDDRTWIYCDDCGAHGPYGRFNYQGNDADEKWNTRTGQPPAQDEANAVIAELVAALERAELLTLKGADIFNSEGSRLLRISDAQREAVLIEARAYTGKAANDNALPTESKTA